MNIVILAAGLGKRMRSALPKVLHPLAGKPLLAHVIETARSLSPTRLVVVVGHGGDRVRDMVGAPAVIQTLYRPHFVEVRSMTMPRNGSTTMSASRTIRNTRHTATNGTPTWLA